MRTAKTYRKHAAYLAVFLAAFAIGAAVVCDMARGAEWCRLWPHFSLRQIQEFIRGSGALGVLASIGLMILHSFVPVPAELIALSNGMVYGVFWGTVISWVGAMSGAFVAFYIARRLGHERVYRFLEKKHMRKVEKAMDSFGPEAILICRFIPVISFNLLNYFAGLTGMSWWTFAWTTGLGILPIMVLMVAMGNRIYELPLIAWGALLLLGLALWGLVHFLYRRHAGEPR